MPKRSFSASSALALALLGWFPLLLLAPQAETEPGPPGIGLVAPIVPDLNAAPFHHLMLLPRVGPARAHAIVREREAAGLFLDLPDLQRVHGIGPRTVAGLEGRALADPPRIEPEPLVRGDGP